MKEKTNKGLNRRDFLGLSAIGLTGLTILPNYVINGVRVAPAVIPMNSMNSFSNVRISMWLRLYLPITGMRL